eukprot:GFYU01002890.1.p1 GENE.GFYU01002890.1~~GFYU01002890.1.p1  ORF type:complete len:252 (-),score=16.93 GFYU01002890.1:122-877(-)
MIHTTTPMSRQLQRTQHAVSPRSMGVTFQWLAVLLVHVTVGASDITGASAQQTATVETEPVIPSCSVYNDEISCTTSTAPKCKWFVGQNSDGTTAGRCTFQCALLTTEEACRGSQRCYWQAGRSASGGSDCTLCLGRSESSCRAAKSCFWDVPGYAGQCVKCPGHLNKEDCEAHGCWWLLQKKGGYKCQKCPAYVDPTTCTQVGCKWDYAKSRCRGNLSSVLSSAESGTRTSGWSVVVGLLAQVGLVWSAE